ncbi:MAG TPA: caspase family protein, partial [Tabrizicola sp.]|nr:caspase family protein [Tabrizicola sp.]
MWPRLPYVLLSGALALTTAPARAEVHAVLVGVSDYLTLDADLRGPANDVRLMAETLALRGVAPGAMTVLTADPTGLPAGAATGQPIRAEILSALAEATDAAQPGDTVVFYFSGHGAQAPDMSGDEGGGYDEILLPADAAGWKGAIGAVENAILDDELQAWAQALLARDVKVVGLIDACHSATGFRAIGSE